MNSGHKKDIYGELLPHQKAMLKIQKEISAGTMTVNQARQVGKSAALGIAYGIAKSYREMIEIQILKEKKKLEVFNELGD